MHWLPLTAWAGMGIALAALSVPLCAADGVLPIPPWTTAVNLEGQPVQVTVSGTAHVVHGAPGAAGAAEPGEGLRLKLMVDLTDLNAHLTELLRAHVNQDNRCGERLDLKHAVLRPTPPGALLVADAHVEKYVCAKAFGKQMTTRLLGGDARLQIRLTPSVEDGQALRMSGEVVAIDATGSVGELLHSEPFGGLLRQKIASSVANALQKSLAHLKGSLPPQARELATLESARFADPGPGRLGLEVNGDVHVSADMARDLLERIQPVPRGREN
jgi:hypothetical protein